MALSELRRANVEGWPFAIMTSLNFLSQIASSSLTWLIARKWRATILF